SFCDGHGTCVGCLSSTDCPSDTLCVKATCNDQTACVTANANPGATCSDHGANVCDGSGKCIGCNHVTDCADTGTTRPTGFAGDQYECAITSGNGLKCWGDNPDGQLGTGDENQQLSPVDVSGLSSGVASGAAYSYAQDTCAVMSDGSAKCWGFNFYGEFGNG